MKLCLLSTAIKIVCCYIKEPFCHIALDYLRNKLDFIDIILSNEE